MKLNIDLFFNIKPNDLLMVTKIDEYSCNKLEFLNLQKILNSIIFVALDLPYLGSLNSKTIVENKKAENLLFNFSESLNVKPVLIISFIYLYTILFAASPMSQDLLIENVVIYKN